MAARKRRPKITFGAPEYSIIHPDMKPIRSHGMKKGYERLLWEAIQYVHTEIAPKSIAKSFITYCQKKHGKVKARPLLKLTDYTFFAVGKYTYVISKGATLDEKLLKRIDLEFNNLLELAKTKVEVKKEEPKKVDKPVISIQQRMAMQVEDLLGEWEGKLDSIVDGSMDISDFLPHNDIESYSHPIKPNHAKIIKETYKGNIAEAEEILLWKDTDLKEAYAHLKTKKSRQAYKAFYDKIFAACDAIINKGKATRKARKPKPVSKEKLVAKLKYQDSEGTLGLASINPVELLDATIVWVYNTKTRKLGVFNVDMGGSFTVKGTTLHGFDETKSRQKTVRKPEQLLKGAGKLSRTKIQKLFNELTTTDIALNGRFNDNTIILRAF